MNSALLFHYLAKLRSLRLIALDVSINAEHLSVAIFSREFKGLFPLGRISQLEERNLNVCGA